MYFAKFDTSAGNSTDLRNPSRSLSPAQLFQRLTRKGFSYY